MDPLDELVLCSLGYVLLNANSPLELYEYESCSALASVIM
jgi:hypothetical protein